MVSTTNKGINNGKPDVKQVHHDATALHEDPGKIPTAQNRSEASSSGFSCRNLDERKFAEQNKDCSEKSKSSKDKHGKANPSDESLSR